MKIVHARPPNFDRLQKQFGISDKEMVFTYGDTLYVPDGRPVDKFLMAHEEEHSKQQGDNPDLAIERYHRDEAFRANCELDAYRAQYRAFTKDQHENGKGRSSRTMLAERINYASRLARDCSGDMYGRCISLSFALTYIRS